MPGIPPFTPNYSIPRWALDDPADFPEQYNAGMDQADAQVADDLETRVNALIGNWQPVHTVFFIYSPQMAPLAIGQVGFPRHRSSISGTGGNVQASGGSSQIHSPFLYRFESSEHAFPGKTTQLRIVTSYCHGLVANPMSFGIGLYPITFAGPSDGISTGFTLGTLIAGSEHVVGPMPSTGAIHFGKSSAFPAPASGYYVFGLRNIADPLNFSARCVVTPRLERRHI